MREKLVELSKYMCGVLLFLCCLNVSAKSRPNVIFILVDDQGYYDLSCYGATEVKTPRIDALAKDGVRFTDFYAAAPICSPSRAGLVTGCYPRRTGNEIWVHRPDSQDGIDGEVMTIAEMFKLGGYSTACVGKWHLGFKEEYLPINQGFDHYYGILHNLDQFEVSHFDDEGGMPFFRDGKVIMRDVSPDGLTKLYTDEVISYIEKKAGEEEPFFVYMPHTMLHIPLGVSPEFKGTSQWGEYGDAIQEMDHHVGRIVDTLERLKIDDNTIVIYSSDNGRHPGRNKTQPIRGSKLTTLEGGLRVPCIVAGPSIRKGFESHVVSHMMDWYTTLATFAGIAIPEDVILDGRDLSAMLEGKTDVIPAFDKSVSLNAEVPLRRVYEQDREWGDKFTQEEFLNAFFYHGSHGSLASVRWGDWKLNIHPDLELYNLKNDPGERKQVRGIGWPTAEQRASKDPRIQKLVEIGNIQTKLRGMIIRFQREMNQNQKKR